MSSGFPISGAPISGAVTSGTSGAVTPAAPLGPGHVFDQSNIKYRYGERYASEATNIKFQGIPRGVYMGFEPTFSGNVLTLSPDTSYGVSLARLTSQDDPLNSVDVFTTEPITLDFTGHTVFPVNVVLRANGAIGQPYSAELITTVAATTDPTEIKVCVVTAIGAVSFDDPANRDSPFAHASAPLGFGFMKDGAAEELLAAIALTTEVQDARVDLTGTTQGSLDARLEADSAAAAMGSRLGKEVRTIRGIDATFAATLPSINVSASFAGSSRALFSLNPVDDIPGFGSEGAVGAITSGTLPAGAPAGSAADSERNVCAVIDVSAGTGTESRLTSETGEVAYGRLDLDEIALSGQLTFDGTVNVVGDGSTLFTSEIEGGDIIEAADGNFYEVASDPVVNNALTLSAAPPPGVATGLTRRRFTLEMLTRDAVTPGAEDSFDVSAGTTVRFFFPTWNTLDTTQYTNYSELNRNHEPEPVPLATTTTSGRALVAPRTPDLPEGKAGAVFSVFQGTVQRGQDHIHTIDFSSAAFAGPGVVNVTQRGPTGAAGAPATGPAGAGPPGPAGPTGPGINVYESFVQSAGWYYHFQPLGGGVTWPIAPHPMAGESGAGVGGGGATYSFIVNFANAPYFWTHVTVATCGVGQYYNNEASFFDTNDHWIITDLDVNTVGGLRTEVAVDFQVPIDGAAGFGTIAVRPFISAAGIS